MVLLATDDSEVAEHLLTVMRGTARNNLFPLPAGGRKRPESMLQHLGRDVPRTHDLVELRRLLGADFLTMPNWTDLARSFPPMVSRHDTRKT